MTRMQGEKIIVVKEFSERKLGVAIEARK